MKMVEAEAGQTKAAEVALEHCCNGRAALLDRSVEERPREDLARALAHLAVAEVQRAAVVGSLAAEGGSAVVAEDAACEGRDEMAEEKIEDVLAAVDHWLAVGLLRLG